MYVLPQVLNGCEENRESHVLLTCNTAALENLWCSASTRIRAQTACEGLGARGAAPLCSWGGKVWLEEAPQEQVNCSQQGQCCETVTT